MTHTFDKKLWFLILIIVLHNWEEATTMKNYLHTFPISLSLNQFYIAQIAITLALTGIFYLYYLKQQQKIYHDLVYFSIVAIFFNSLSHLIQFIILRIYVPGIISALTLLLPASIFFILQNKKNILGNKGDIFKYIFGGLLIYFFSLILGFSVSWLLTR